MLTNIITTLTQLLAEKRGSTKLFGEKFVNFYVQLFEVRLYVNYKFGRGYGSVNGGTCVLMKLNLLAILCVRKANLWYF